MYGRGHLGRWLISLLYAIVGIVIGLPIDFTGAWVWTIGVLLVSLGGVRFVYSFEEVFLYAYTLHGVENLYKWL